MAAMAICVLFALFGNALIGESLGNWYGALDKPWFLVPLWAFYIAGFVYYVLFATVLYRILTRVEDRRVRVTALALALCVLFLNKLWNYGFFVWVLRSGEHAPWVRGYPRVLDPLTALVVALRR